MDKVCPVVLRGDALLLFRHPFAGVQLVKGGIEAGEASHIAATRELAEESGLTLDAKAKLGKSDTITRGQTWHFWQMADAPLTLPDRWTFRTQDDGGHDFAFFWHPLSAALPDDCAAPFHRAMAFITERLNL